jgi:hypothetical protein
MSNTENSTQDTNNKQIIVEHDVGSTITTIICDNKIESVTITSYGSGWRPWRSIEHKIEENN